MEAKIQREWCPGEGQEIPVELVETDWGWGTCIDCNQEAPVSRDRETGLRVRECHPRRIDQRPTFQTSVSIESSRPKAN
jgi:hypothetical protein